MLIWPGSNASAIALASPQSTPSRCSWATSWFEAIFGDRGVVEQLVDGLDDRIVHVGGDGIRREADLVACASRRAWSAGVAIRAGMPTAVDPAGTSRTTTALEPTLAPSPTRIGPRILAPAPITTLRPSVGWRLPLFHDVPPSVTPW